MNERIKVWNKLADSWRVNNMDSLTTICKLNELDPYIDEMLKGGSKGRVVVEMEV